MLEFLKLFRVCGIASCGLSLFGCWVVCRFGHRGIRRKVCTGGLAICSFFGAAYAVQSGAMWYANPWPGSGAILLRMVFFPFYLLQNFAFRPVLTGIAAAFAYGLGVWLIHPIFALKEHDRNRRKPKLELEGPVDTNQKVRA